MKKFLACILLIIMVLPLRARRYPFVRVERNQVQFPAGDSPDFRRFLRKTDSLVLVGTGSVRVLHVGGSHVHGGTWSGRLRNHFLALRYGMDGGRGLVSSAVYLGQITVKTKSDSTTIGSAVDVGGASLLKSVQNVTTKVLADGDVLCLCIAGGASGLDVDSGVLKVNVVGYLPDVDAMATFAVTVPYRPSGQESGQNASKGDIYLKR